MLPQYFTVNEYGSHEINIQKSRFIAYVARAETEQAAQDFITKIKKQHWDATHNCSAYLIGENDQIQKANDDGEPSGTAGTPILEVLKKKHLKDTVVVITRYFGGIKLGAGGLIRAYGKATSEGITHTGIVERVLVTTMKIKAEYHLLGKIERSIRESEFKMKEIHYNEAVEIEAYVEMSKVGAFKEWMVDLTNGQTDLSEGEQVYLENPVE
ncbi:MULTISPECIES: YigZ family protein [unclassified Bacillus (in: firmicutes)]|uniref:YigZ family protein n=1 Tax=unclassified Bacillus (in: firmicutes) TaxID=185979 RepID=UPI0008EA2DBA|nr:MULTISPECIES: YigZ family protein [unclassified Bacillus (in: firmicutes)]SFB25399.1 uncharacterized protein, YigZ family [Bacillus sp. UNCCL13]SFQ91734.1 uncharacterized protein, YigZ family [Bacillus sp. cl95]